MAHRRHAVKRRLAIEQNLVAVQHVSVNRVALVNFDRLCVDVFETDGSSYIVGIGFRAIHGFGTRIDVWTILDHCIQSIDVDGRHDFGKRQIHRDFQRNAELRHGNIGIRRNNGPRTILDALSL